jgi:heat shock protein HslJ
MRLRARSTLVLLLAALISAMVIVTVAACGTSGGGGHALDGTSWRLTGWTLDSLAPADFTITAAFAGGRISGTSAVNTYDGSYTTTSSGGFSVGQLAATEMAGPKPAMRAEGAYLKLLAQASSYKLAGGALTLLDANGNDSLIFRRATL